VAAQPESRGQVVTFANDHLSCCKHHVRVFDRPNGPVVGFPAAFGEAERVHQVVGLRALYLAYVKFDVILAEPFERRTTSFLWPFRLEWSAHHLIVRLVALEKNLSAYFESSVLWSQAHAERERRSV